MKKIITIVLVLVLVCSLCACGKKSSSSYLVQDGKFTVSLSPDFSPMEFVDTSKSGQNQYVGFDPTLAKFIADELGLELVIKPMSFDACQAAVQSKNVDCSISGFSYTPARAENFLLSDYYYAGDNETKQTVVVLKENEGKYSSAEDFAGLTVGAQVASLQWDLATAQLEPAGATIEVYTDIGTAVEALRNGKIDALAVAEGNGNAIIAGNDAVAMSGFWFEISAEAENNVILINKDNQELLEKINACLKKAYESGYYAGWYNDAKALAGIETASEISYDDAGNVDAG